MWRNLTRLTLLDLLVDVFFLSLVAAILIPGASEVTIGRLYPRWAPDETAPQCLMVRSEPTDPRPRIQVHAQRRFPREWKKLGFVPWIQITFDSPCGHNPNMSDDMNILYFSGSVSAPDAGSPAWDAPDMICDGP